VIAGIGGCLLACARIGLEQVSGIISSAGRVGTVVLAERRQQ
jgi:hypothetical protein